MSLSDLHHLRMVIQQISVEPVYRVVVYGDREKPRHADFHGEAMLLRAVHAAIPGFDASGLTLDPLRGGQGSIVFSREIELTNRQLGLLGFADARR